MANQTITIYVANVVTARMDIETAKWKVCRREFVGTMEMATENPEMLLEIARVVLLELGKIADPEMEMDLQPRTRGRFMVLNAAFGTPLIEFDPNVKVD